MGVKTDFSRIYEKLGDESCKRAASSIIGSVAADVTREVPRNSGRLRASMRVVDGTKMRWETPYADVQYWTNKSHPQWAIKAKKKYGSGWAARLRDALL